MHYFLYTPSSICDYSKDNKVYYKSMLLMYIRYYKCIPYTFELINMFLKTCHIPRPDIRSLNLKYVMWSKQKPISPSHLRQAMYTDFVQPTRKSQLPPSGEKEDLSGDLRYTSGGGVRGRREGMENEGIRAFSLIQI